jgi:hypothetical protein
MYIIISNDIHIHIYIYMDSMDKPPSFLHIYALSRVAKARCQGCCPRIWIKNFWSSLLL